MKGKGIILIFILCSYVVKAQWLLNFGGANTVQAGDAAFISGTGGQATFLRGPSTVNFTPFLAHAGIRVGVLNNLDVGYRLCTVPLPYNGVGPSLGSAVDFKLRLTSISSLWQCGIIMGGGYAYVELMNQSRGAWSPGGALVITKALSAKTTITLNGRYVLTDIPTALGGNSANNVQAIGGSIGLAVSINSGLSILPEAGVFNLVGKINNQITDGVGMQFGVVLKVDWNKTFCNMEKK